jgi:N-acetylneuraminate synthase
VLARHQLAIKKPGTGISPDRLDEVVGRRLTRDVAADHVLMPDDVEGVS